MSAPGPQRNVHRIVIQTGLTRQLFGTWQRLNDLSAVAQSNLIAG
jgi:hypothetical protein